MRKHISFSELKIWNECAYKHKLVYIDEIKKFLGNEYTAFGTAIHDVCEKTLTEKTEFDQVECFNISFLNELKILQEKSVVLKKGLIEDMRVQGAKLVKYVLPAVNACFKDYEVVSAEEQLYIPLPETNQNFKGFIDLVLKTKDGMYHVIDWKTCSWGWDSRKKSDKMLTYQLTLYKNFFARKHNIDPEKITTYFALLKRTANKNCVEIFDVPSGAKKIENALKLLNKALYNIEKERFVKNRLSCTSGYGCEFYNTKYCSR
jgi:RecB family exonuclease